LKSLRELISELDEMRNGSAREMVLKIVAAFDAIDNRLKAMESRIGEIDKKSSTEKSSH
jgi:hypothetical protein